MAAHHSKVAAASESTAYNISRQQKQAFLQGSADAHVSSLCWKKVVGFCGLLNRVAVGQIKRQPGSPHHDGRDRMLSLMEERNQQVAAHHNKVAEAAASDARAYSQVRQRARGAAAALAEAQLQLAEAEQSAAPPDGR